MGEADPHNDRGGHHQVASAEWGWGEVEAEAVRPYGPGLFWACANALYRQVALKYLALALLHLGALPPRQPGVCWFRGPGLAAVLRVWVLALLDPRQSKVQVRRVLRVASDPFPRARGKELGCRPRSRGPLLQSARRTH